MNRRMIRNSIAGLSLVLSTVSLLSAQAEQPQDDGGPRPRMHRQFGGEFKGTAGQISEIRSDSLVLKTEQGTQTVKITDKTMFRREGSAAKLADFKVGDFVFVGGEPGANNTWTAAFVGIRGQGGPVGMMRGEFSPDQLGKKFIIGEVMKIDGTKLTLKRPDGVEQTIAVDEDTSFRKRGNESVTLADIKVGDRVGGRGEIKNGVFVPAVLNLGMPGGMGAGGHGNGNWQRHQQPDAPAQNIEPTAPKEEKQ